MEELWHCLAPFVNNVWLRNINIFNFELEADDMEAIHQLAVPNKDGLGLGSEITAKTIAVSRTEVTS
jgi:hypothetical protein